MLAANQTTHELALAVRDGADRKAKGAHLRAAQAAAAQMSAVLAQAEHGAFDTWYDSERIFGVDKRERDIAALTP